jgi:hypothetical protein
MVDHNALAGNPGRALKKTLARATVEIIKRSDQAKAFVFSDGL